MQSTYAGPISRSSSATLSKAQQPSIFDDMNIAAGLLAEPKDPRHRSSFTGGSFGGHEGSEQPPQQTGQPDGNRQGRSRRAVRTSNTWTSSSGDVLSDHDDVDDRSVFVQEYNRLARKHGVRQVDPEELDTFNDDLINISAKPGNWFSRKILRRTSSSQSVKLKPERHLKHRRSISDLSIRLKSKRDKLKDKDLQELVRLCGSSLLYLPTEYAAGSLAVPTCFRATAQHLVQHAPSTRGVFRVPGSQAAVAALYNHYGNMDEEGQVISGTVRCPTLPDHIRCDVHDVASAFKKFISGLPGGILGSLHLFKVLVSIQTQLRGDPELTRTKQSKVRARLIALAIATLRSQYRRELICAVFGLLSMIGRAAEIAPREDDRGRPLPTSDLMGYGPLGVVFGPLLVGDFLEEYTMRIANPQGGLVLLPVSPPKSRRDRHKKSKAGDEGTAFNTHVDKIKVANSITEMLITHWRDVVRHMRNLSALKIVASTMSVAIRAPRQPMLRPSASESFALRKPPDWDQFRSPLRRLERSVSPIPARRTHGHEDAEAEDSASRDGEMLVVKKQRSKNKPLSSQRLSGGRSLSILSPTAEERYAEEQSESPAAISPPCGDPPCTSESLPLKANPVKEAIYSPSSSSEGGAISRGTISLPVRREEPKSPDWLDKENQNPRPSQTERSRILNPFDYDNRQPLHFMSTPTFSSVSPPKSSRKKARHSKESSSSTGMGKHVRNNGSPSRLQKKSPGCAERGHFKNQKESEQLEEHPNVERSESRDYNAELGQFAAEWSALDLRRKVLLTAKSKKEMQSFKAVLDAEQALLEARYASILADKAAFEKRQVPVVEPRFQPLNTENASVEAKQAAFRSAQGQNELLQGVESDSLQHALEAIDRERQTLEVTQLDLESDWEMFVNKWEQTTASEQGKDGAVILDAGYAALRNRMTILESAEDAIQANTDDVAEHGVKHLHISPKQDKTDRAQGASQIVEQSSRNDASQKEPAIHLPTSTPNLHNEELPLSRNVPNSPSEIVADISATIRPDLTVFKRDVAAWKTKWKSYKQGKQTISSSEKKVHDDEKVALDCRWNALKARMDAQSDAGEAKGLSKSSFSPFKHLDDKPKQFLSVPSPLKPGIAISRASSHGSDENNPRSPRRIGGSDPGLQARARSHSPRRISKSLYEDPKSRKKLFDLSKVSRDPLLRISREEDNASLAVLAQALDEPVQQQDSDAENSGLNDIVIPNITRNEASHDNQNPLSQPVSLKENRNTINHLYQYRQLNTIDDKADALSDGPKHFKLTESGRVTEESNERPREVQILQGQRPTSSTFATTPSSSRLMSTNPPSDLSIPVLPMQVPNQKLVQNTRRSTAPNTPANETGTANSTRVKAAGSPNKISALVARFNQAKQPSTSVSPHRMTPDRSPAKTPIRTIPDTQGDLGAKVVSPYTTNPPSPTKSQKSDKTPQSSRTTGVEARSLLDPKSSPVRRQTPKRVLRDSLYDSSPLRPVPQDSDTKIPRSLSSPTKAPNIYAVSLRPVQKNADGSPTRMPSGSTNAVQDTRERDGTATEEQENSVSKNKGISTSVPPPRFSLDSFTKTGIHVKKSPVSSTKTVRTIHEATIISSLEAAKVNSGSNHVHWNAEGASTISQGPSNLPAFDDPPIASNVGRMLPRPDPMPVAQHLQLSRPPASSPANSSDGTGMDMDPAKHTGNHLPGRSSSILYKQVMNLQRQLSEKTEEIQHLKQFLNARESLDIGTLSEELRQTKRDLQIWKNRAEVAEKQLEITSKLPSRSDSLKHGNVITSRSADRQHRSSTDSRQEGGTMVERVRKALHGQHGMDGADSPRRYSSEESTGTVVRDYRDVISAIENEIWQEHTMNGNSRGDSE